MRNRKLATLALSTAALGGVLVAAPAAGAATCTTSATTTCTPVSVTLTGGGLSVATADSNTVVLKDGSANGVLGALSGALTGSMPATTVTDSRGTFVGWTVSAKTSGDLVNGTSSRSIPLGTSSSSGPLTISAGALGVVPGLGGLLPTGGVAGGSGSLNPTQAVTVMQMPAAGNVVTGLTGGGAYTYTASLSLTVPAGTAADTYTTTVVQTVA